MILTMYICIAFATLYVVFGEVNTHKGHCYWWTFGDYFFIDKEQITNSLVMTRTSARSFLECCIQCDVSQGCTGVAYADEECKILNGTVTEVLPDSNSEQYRVMMHVPSNIIQVGLFFFYSVYCVSM